MANFIAELWSDKIIEDYKQVMAEHMRPKRSKAAQMLRDAALGHPEFPKKKAYKAFNDFPKHKTATEVRIQNEHARHCLDSRAYAMAAVHANISKRSK